MTNNTSSTLSDRRNKDDYFRPVNANYRSIYDFSSKGLAAIFLLYYWEEIEIFIRGGDQLTGKGGGEGKRNKRIFPLRLAQIYRKSNVREW